MSFGMSYGRKSSRGALLVAVLLTSTTARADLLKVTVGVTPTCPYGITACWSGARAGLSGMAGVKSAPNSPDGYNCTADVHYDGHELPDPGRWEESFKKSVGDVYGFRGVEVTVNGFLELSNGKLTLRSEGIAQPITLVRLEHKLQYNFRKHQPREAEPEELNAYGKLLERMNALSGGQTLPVEIVGPLRFEAQTPTIEVRESHHLAR